MTRLQCPTIYNIVAHNNFSVSTIKSSALHLAAVTKYRFVLLVSKKIAHNFKKIQPTSCFRRTVPIFDWLPRYKWKKDLYGDIIAGVTVAVMHIPQGMAYAMLGNVPAITGIYMAFFPVLIYFIFGTSKHNSMGTFAVICMMTGKIVLAHSTFLASNPNNSTALHTDYKVSASQEVNLYSPTEVAAAVTFTVSIMQVMLKRYY
ncbi:hypothetical protein TKK_0016074 [Trichogramma kaykai]